MKILVTGFDPFGGEPVNPAYEAVQRLPETIAGAEILKLELPTAFARSVQVLEGAIRDHAPDAVVSIGQAGGRACVTPEAVAINLAEASIPDNDGFQPAAQPLVPEGPAAYFSTLPVRAMAARAREHGVPCRLSYSAGTYVCNCVMYQALHLAATKYPGLRAGFIHVPYSLEQAASKPAGTPCASLDTITQALVYALEAIALGCGDAAGSEGSTH